jgi:RNA polymerase sigma-70 factor (ECF subfamily)
MPDSSDRALVLRVRGGDPEAFGELVQRYQTSVYNVCYRLLGETGAAEDQAQEAFIRAYERLDRYDAERPFGPWVRRVAANLCLNRLGSLKSPALSLDDERDEPSLGPAASAAAADPAAAHEAAELASALRAAIAALPPGYRAVIELRHFHDLSYAEIAAELGLPMSDVKSNLFRARKLLARQASLRQLRPGSHD